MDIPSDAVSGVSDALLELLLSGLGGVGGELLLSLCVDELVGEW
jgi:hypothetical protein